MKRKTFDLMSYPGFKNAVLKSEIISEGWYISLTDTEYFSKNEKVYIKTYNHGLSYDNNGNVVDLDFFEDIIENRKTKLK